VIGIGCVEAGNLNFFSGSRRGFFLFVELVVPGFFSGFAMGEVREDDFAFALGEDLVLVSALGVDRGDGADSLFIFVVEHGLVTGFDWMILGGAFTLFESFLALFLFETPE
jgi:hypothetical protein